MSYSTGERTWGPRSATKQGDPFRACVRECSARAAAAAASNGTSSLCRVRLSLRASCSAARLPRAGLTFRAPTTIPAGFASRPLAGHETKRRLVDSLNLQVMKAKLAARSKIYGLWLGAVPTTRTPCILWPGKTYRPLVLFSPFFFGL
jgi:hypothetical protein